MKKQYFFLTTSLFLIVIVYLGPDFMTLSPYIQNLRLTKLIGMALAVALLIPSTIAFQTLVASSYLSPAILGMDALYLFLHTGLAWLFPISQASGLSNLMLNLGQALIMVSFTWLLLARIKIQEIQQLNQGKWLMIGLVFGNVLRAMTQFLQAMMDPSDFLSLQSYLQASFQGLTWPQLMVTGLVTWICLGIIYLNRHLLDVFQLGPSSAQTLGVNVSRAVRLLMIVIVIMVQAATALVGPLTFLGFLIANVTDRFSASHRHLHKLNLAILIGAISLIGGQLLVERLINFRLSLTIILEGLGGLVFFILLFRRQTP